MYTNYYSDQLAFYNLLSFILLIPLIVIKRISTTL